MPIPAGFIANQGGVYSRGDGAAPFAYDGTSMVPQWGSVTFFASGNVANATASATIPAVAGKTSYITGCEVTGAGATAGSVVLLTFTGVLGGTATYNIVVPAGASTSIVPFLLLLKIPVAASAANVAIVASVAAFGAGNTNAALVLRGFTV